MYVQTSQAGRKAAFPLCPDPSITHIWVQPGRRQVHRRVLLLADRLEPAGPLGAPVESRGLGLGLGLGQRARRTAGHRERVGQTGAGRENEDKRQTHEARERTRGAERDREGQ